MLINNHYPPEYWTLPNVKGIAPTPELWWSSAERSTYDRHGVASTEVLELDFGRLRHINFMGFDIMKKPIDIAVEYDSLSFADGTHNWVPVTRVTNERFDSYLIYDPKSTNPWQHCQFYFTNRLGKMISTRWVRITFTRRPSQDAANQRYQPNQKPGGLNFNTFPWSIDVRNMRTARIALSVTDTRGILLAPIAST